MRCPSTGGSGSVAWYTGTDDASIYSSLCAACKVDASELVEFVEDTEDKSTLMNIFDSPKPVSA